MNNEFNDCYHFDDDVPEWDRAIGCIWIGNELSEEKRLALINSKNHIWPRNFTIDEKNDFLDKANIALNFWKLRRDDGKEKSKGNSTPKEQRNQLIELVQSIQKLKRQLCKLDGELLERTNMKFAEARYLSKPTIGLIHRDQYGHHIESLLQETWVQLTNTERVLDATAKNIYVDVSYRPENHINDCIVFELADAWKHMQGKYPPRSKTGWFAKFIVELGEAVDLKLSSEMAKRCIDRMEEIETKIAEEK